MQHASGRVKRGAVESHRMPQHDTSVTQDCGERVVRRCRASAFFRSLARAAGIAEPIGFGEDHVEGNRRRAHVPETSDQFTDAVASPRPLPDRRQAAFIHIDNDDTALWRPRGDRPQQNVVRRRVEPGEHRRGENGEHSGDDHRAGAAQEHEPSSRWPGLR
jgi:hypothetical protein